MHTTPNPSTQPEHTPMPAGPPTLPPPVPPSLVPPAAADAVTPTGGDVADQDLGSGTSESHVPTAWQRHLALGVGAVVIALSGFFVGWAVRGDAGTGTELQGTGGFPGGGMPPGMAGGNGTTDNGNIPMPPGMAGGNTGSGPTDSGTIDSPTTDSSTGGS